MDWQSELTGSAMWFVQTLTWVTAAFAVAFFVLTRYTDTGRKFWHITKQCLTNTSIIKTVLMVVVLIAFVLIEVRISVLNTFFYNGLYTSLQEMKPDAFWFFALINASLVGIKVIQEIIDVLIGQVFEIRWLEKLNAVLLNRWLDNQNYYRLSRPDNAKPDNIDQRIEQDATAFITDTLEMVRGVLNAILSSIEFTIILWGLSGVLVLAGIEIPKGVVFLVYGFIITATVISVWIGRPLIRLNFEKEHRHGDYRYALVRVRDHAESIAFYQGERQEKRSLTAYFRAIIDNRWAIIKRSLGLGGFNTGVTQFAMLLPIMLQAPRFFAGQIKLGDVHQTVQSFNRLMRALSFFRLFYEDFTLYQARVNRLYGFFHSLDNIDKKADKADGDTHQTKNDTLVQSADVRLALQQFGLISGDGQLLFCPVDMTLRRGDRLLIQGESGVGKTSLLRAMAGIYPLPTVGAMHLDVQQKLHFTPQKSYIPQGSLRDVVTYPAMVVDDESIAKWLSVVGLKQLAKRLDDIEDWQAYLSPGQAQRIGFVRILLARPDVIFLDEATSALDEANEKLMYTLLATHLPDSVVVSIGHRSSLHEFHHKTIQVTRAVNSNAHDGL
ncbi:ABC transporter ATP-binding protein/permease [Moraxella sp. FZLJ2107]|uniref:ABC transporter ATP-binding protein/permease n=1 Tax=unclassified Moraxella TaxID=2685852 RepID=UPI0020C908CC|nr:MULTISPECIES: ABC transporter ATP-binding protein/permease [unclassified Moraxella]UTO04245.1 ABC transporter ATP-binding protein/permease [Moraxella sp. FZLJ2107]UTO23078.1 ABC transporter ATP-binding protein/permease [Moraxella sp. FZLJ2109]